MESQNLDFDREFFGRYIAKRLRERRESLWITLMDLADKLWVKHPTITSILNGKSIASIKKYQEVAEKLWIYSSEFEELVKEARHAEMMQHGLNCTKDDSEESKKEWFALLSHIAGDPEAYDEALTVLEWVKNKHGIK